MEIDGSYGEGGGQLLRFALGLSALLGEELKVVNIRANRTPPGLRPQHLAAVKAVSKLANARTEGVSVGSSAIKFSPGRVAGGNFEFDVGTAGSVTLVLQALLPVALMAERTVSGVIRGGTEVRWSPTVDYFERVFARGLRAMGVDLSLRLAKSGYYPKGGGVVEFRVEPTPELRPLVAVEDPGDALVCKGVSRCARLPTSVAERQASSARALLASNGVRVGDLEIISTNEPDSPGSSVTLWADSPRSTFIGAECIGERGKPAEIVGSEAARAFLSCVEARSATDEHFADMILPYMLKARGRSTITTTRISRHLSTEVHVAREFKVAEISIDSGRSPPILTVSPNA
jgi:RNA 3'-phosphate cyclase